MKELLERVEVPNAEGAEERAWLVVRAAAAQDGNGGVAELRNCGAKVRPRRLAAIAAVLGVLGLLVASPAGSSVRHWVADRIDPEPPPARVADARPVLGSLPGGGRLLVTSPDGAWVVAADGARRRIGDYREVTWSPHGLFVGAVDERGLSAVTPKGEVRWALGRERVSGIAWSPSGFRIAYRSAGELRVVAGDGTGDRAIGAFTASAPAWRTATARHLLTAVERHGRVLLIDTDAGKRLWRTDRGGEPPTRLLWSSDGRRLAAVGRKSIRIFDSHGRLLQRRHLPLGVTADDAAFARRGHTLAYARRRPGLMEVVLLDAERRGGERVASTSAGVIGDLAWSPDGRWFLTGWWSADQWVFTRAAPGRGGVRAVDGVAKQFDPDRRPGGAAPRIAGWCCAR